MRTGDDQTAGERAFRLGPPRERTPLRDNLEYRRDHVDGAKNLPLDELRDRLAELPKDRPIWAYCFVGQRSYYAARALIQYGFDVKNLSGGFNTYLQHEASKYL